MAGKPKSEQWTAAQDDELRRLHKQGIGCGEAARRMGRNRATVSIHAKALGLIWPGSAMIHPAARGREAQLQEQRQRVLGQMWERIESTLGRMGAEKYRTLIRGEYGTEGVVDLDFVPGRDVRDLASAVTSLARAAAQLEETQRQKDANNSVDAWLLHMLGEDAAAAAQEGVESASGSDGGIPAAGAGDGQVLPEGA